MATVRRGGHRPQRSRPSRKDREVQRAAGELRDLPERLRHHRRGQRLGRRRPPVDPDDLATIAPYITQAIRRFGDWVLDLSLPEAAPVTALNLAPGVLFPNCSPAAGLTRIPGDPELSAACSRHQEFLR